MCRLDFAQRGRLREMKLVVGLGNPGGAYTKTRHNLGFMVIDSLLDDFGARLKNDAACGYLKIRLDFKKKDFILCKPLTYMNLSGVAVLKLLRKNNLKAEDVLVICDDVRLALGRIKIKAKGSAGGHKGLESIIKSLRSQMFARLRVGVAAPQGQKTLEGYVLSPFTCEEQKVIQGSIEKARQAVLCWLENGTEAAMNRFN